MNRQIALLQHLVHKQSGWIIFLFALGLVLSLAGAARLRVDSGIESLMLRDDPDRDRTRMLKREFSNDEVLVVALDFGRPVDHSALVRLRALSRQIEAIQAVEEVLDLTNIEDIRGDGYTLDASPLVDWDEVEGDISSIRERVRDHRLYRRTLASDDLEVLALVVVLEADATETGAADFATARILELLQSPGSGEDCRSYVAGYPMASYDSNRIMSRDLTLLGGVAYLVILVLVIGAYRHWLPAILITLLAFWSQLAAMAYYGFRGIPLSVSTSTVSPLLLATAGAYGIYFIAMLRTVADEEEPEIAVLRPVTRPVCLSVVTTVCGFMALNLIPVEGIGHLGTGLSVGILAAGMGTLLLFPAVIHRCFHVPELNSPAVFDEWAIRGVAFANRPALTLVVGAALIGIIGTGVAFLRVESNPLSYWSHDSYHRKSVEFIRDRIGATIVVSVVIGGVGEYSALEPELLGFASELIREIEANPIVDRTLSILDYLHLMEEAMEPDANSRTLPTGDLAAQYLFLYESGSADDDLRHYINSDRSRLNILTRINRRNSSDILALRAAVLERSEGAPEGVEVEVLGSMVLFGKAMLGVTRGMIAGLTTSLVAIFIVMAVGFASIRIAAVALIANLLPLLVCVGFLGWTGGTLSFATSIIGCIVLALAVDDTAHVLGHVSRHRTLLNTYRTVGAALILTTLSLGGGFSVLLLSEFEAVRTMGLATVVTLLAALLCDLLLLPSLLRLAGLCGGTEPTPKSAHAPELHGHRVI